VAHPPSRRATPDGAGRPIDAGRCQAAQWRRAGDPPQLVGDPRRINELFGWTATNGLPEIIASAWEAWQAGPRRIEVAAHDGAEGAPEV